MNYLITYSISIWLGLIGLCLLGTRSFRVLVFPEIPFSILSFTLPKKSIKAFRNVIFHAMTWYNVAKMRIFLPFILSPPPPLLFLTPIYFIQKCHFSSQACVQESLLHSDVYIKIILCFIFIIHECYVLKRLRMHLLIK